MKYDTSLQRKPIRSYEIHGIASMMRDLEWLTEDVPAMEAAILATQRLDHLLRADLEVRSGDQLTASRRRRSAVPRFGAGSLRRHGNYLGR